MACKRIVLRKEFVDEILTLISNMTKKEIIDFKHFYRNFDIVQYILFHDTNINLKKSLSKYSYKELKNLNGYLKSYKNFKKRFSEEPKLGTENFKFRPDPTYISNSNNLNIKDEINILKKTLKAWSETDSKMLNTGNNTEYYKGLWDRSIQTLGLINEIFDT